MNYEFINESKEKTDTKKVIFSPDNTITPIQEVTDIAQTIKELNSTERTKDSKFSQIDLKTRLLSVELSAISAFETLIAMKFLPVDAGFLTESVKRHKVSLNGLGRAEIVQIAQGMKEKESGKSFFDRIGAAFRGGQ